MTSTSTGGHEQTMPMPGAADDAQLSAGTAADMYLGHAEELLENALLHVDVDRPDPKNSTYSVDQILDLWKWYKQKAGNNVEAYERFLNRPFTEEEKQELEHLAGRMGWGSKESPSSSAFAWKYKKLKDLETVYEASKHLTPEMRKAYLASKNAPLDVFPAEAIDMAPEDVVRTADKRAAADKDEVGRDFHNQDLSSYYKDAAVALDLSKYVAEYSEESEWWPGWKDASYVHLPTQPFLRALTSILVNTPQPETTASSFPSSVQNAAANTDAGTDVDDESDPEAVLWRALPLDLDPFVMLNQDQGRRAGTVARQHNDEAERWANQKRAFLLSAACVLGFAAFQWVRRRWAARHHRQAARVRQSTVVVGRLPAS